MLGQTLNYKNIVKMFDTCKWREREREKNNNVGSLLFLKFYVQVRLIYFL